MEDNLHNFGQHLLASCYFGTLITCWSYWRMCLLGVGRLSCLIFKVWRLEFRLVAVWALQNILASPAVAACYSHWDLFPKPTKKSHWRILRPLHLGPMLWLSASASNVLNQGLLPIETLCQRLYILTRQAFSLDCCIGCMCVGVLQIELCESPWHLKRQLHAVAIGMCLTLKHLYRHSSCFCLNTASAPWHC